jgi:hypothetical protein
MATFTWHENLGHGTQWANHVITSGTSVGNYSASVAAADIDNDGDLDAVCGYKDLVWIENDGAGQFSSSHSVFTYSGFVHIVTRDWDNDGDVDILSMAGSSIFLQSNNGAGTSWHVTKIEQSISASDLNGADLDADGDIDVLCCTGGGSSAYWYENLGNNLFSSSKFLGYSALSNAILASDIDADGDKDIILGTATTGSVDWFENLGSGLFSPKQSIAALGGSMRVTAFDVDGDGINDIVYGQPGPPFGGHNVMWLKSAGNGSFGAAQAVPTSLYVIRDLDNGDIDGDGDPDLVCATTLGRITWNESFSYRDCNANGVDDSLDIVVGTSNDCNGNDVPDECDLLVFGADIDNDGQLDICTPPPLLADRYDISLMHGGVQNFEAVGLPYSQIYLLIGSISGTSPGLQLDGVHIPINIDAYTAFTISNANSALLVNTSGFTFGTASASLVVPAGFDPSLVGITLHHTCITQSLFTGAVTFATNSVPTTLLP